MSTIAREANVATSTVSRALRGDLRIGNATREHIHTLAQRMGYMAHPLISAFMAQVRNRHSPVVRWNLAWLDFHDSPHAWRADAVSVAFYKGVCSRAEAAGYAVERIWVRDPKLRNVRRRSKQSVKNVRDALANPKRLTDVLLARGIKGIFLQGFTEGISGDAAAIPVDINQFAIVSVGTRFHTPSLHYASNDQHLSSQLAVRELYKLGYRKIGYIGEPLTESIVANRFIAGYLATMQQEFGLDPLPPMVTADRKKVIAWVMQHRPEVIISTERDIIKLLRGCGLIVPHDIGYAHLHVASDDVVTTGICQHSEAVAAAATDLLIGALTNNETTVPIHPRGVLIHGRWNRGKTAMNFSLK